MFPMASDASDGRWLPMASDGLLDGFTLSGSWQLFEFDGAETSVLIQIHGAEGDSVLTLMTPALP